MMNMVTTYARRNGLRFNRNLAWLS